MEIFLIILSVIINITNFLTKPIFWLINRGQRKYVPPVENKILRICATDLAEKIRNKELTCEELCTAYINRIKQVNPIVNAVVEDRFKDALIDAKNVDFYLTRANEMEIANLKEKRPLFGVPITIKESCSLKGMSQCTGAKSRLGIKSENDGVIVSRLKQAGAIPLCVTTTPELCLSWETHNLVTGTTRNPYDTTCTSGGSSGGEGALLGSAASVIGIGSDVAGSIRLPAMYNGVFGHKPTPRIASIRGHYPYCEVPEYPDFLVIGPLTRYARDLKLLLNVMVEPEVKEELKLYHKVDLSQMNVYYMEDIGYGLHLPSVDKEIKNCVKKVVEHLKTNCHSKVRDHKFTGLKKSNEIFGSTLFSIKDIPNLVKGENSNLFAEIFKSLVGRSNLSFSLLYFYFIQEIYTKCVGNYYEENLKIKNEFIHTLGETGVFIYPTFTNSCTRNHQTFFKMTCILYLLLANSLGLPATHVPCGFDKNGMPIGVQVIAGPKQDRLCLAVAEELEKAFGGWVPPQHSKLS